MESSFSKLYYYKLERLRYFNNRSKIKTYQRRSSRNHQRLIPLTREIQKAMMDFNSSESSTSDFEKAFHHNISLTTFVKEVFYNTLRELSISDQFIHKGDIDKIIQKSLIEKIADIKEYTIVKIEKSMEDMSEDTDLNKVIAQSIDTLEHRINLLEIRLNSMLKNIPKLRHIQANRFKNNMNSVKEKLNVLFKLDAPNEKEKQYIKRNVSIDANSTKEIAHNIYDDIFYSTREYAMNMLNYKKSLESLALNQKPQWNPYVRPVTVALSPQENFKRCSIFLATYDKIYDK